MQKKISIKILAALLCVVLLTITACTAIPEGDGNKTDWSRPTGGNYWDTNNKSTKKPEPTDDLTPNIVITEIGANKDTITGNIISQDYNIYQAIEVNLAYSLEEVGFSVDVGIALNNEEDASSDENVEGLLYYNEDLKIYQDSYFAAGFYQIVEKQPNKNPNRLKRIKSDAYLVNLSHDSETDYIYTYDYEDIGYDHFILNDEYVIYYQVDGNTIAYERYENKRENYVSLGSLFNYDTKMYVYDESIFGPYQPHSALELFSNEDYNNLKAELSELSQKQLENGYIVEEYKIIYISPESIQAWLDSEEEATFFGYRVEDLTAAFGVGTALEYTNEGFKAAQVIEPTNAPYDWKTFLIKVGIGCGIIIVGAALSTVTVGATFGCALLTISKIAINFALTSALGTLAIETVTGMAQGKTIQDSLLDASKKGLDSFANGLIIGAVIGSVGVCTGLIKPTACFVEGTPVSVLNADGTLGQKAIECVAVGDTVLSYDEASATYNFNAVTQTYAKPASDLVKISVDNSVVTATANHPFWLVGKGWVQAGYLQKGDKLLSTDGRVLTVSDVEKLTCSTTVYNLTVQNDHTYFVGKTPILVHNSCQELTDNEISNARSKASKKAKEEAVKEICATDKYGNYTLDIQNSKYSHLDNDIIEFVRDHGRFPSYYYGDTINGVPTQVDFCHYEDVKNIVARFNNGQISKQAALDLIANPNNGILATRATHFNAIHMGSWLNTSNKSVILSMASDTLKAAILNAVPIL